MSSIEGNEVQGCLRTQRLAMKANVSALLLFPISSPSGWCDVTELLEQLSVIGSCDIVDVSHEEDSSGRLFLSKLISRNPPPVVVEAALKAFPEALHQNPAAFFTACRDASSEVLVVMLRHCIKTRKDAECPYPWLISGHVSLDGAKALVEAYPEGVLEESRLLGGHNLLDFFLMSKDMVEQRKFDVTLWNKFKLILLAAEYATGESKFSPVHTILRRVMSRPELFTNEEQSHHIVWLLHQLRWTDRWVFEKQDRDGKYPVHMMLSAKCTIGERGLPVAREIVKILLEACPSCVKQMIGGRTALHMAVGNGWPCHDLLLALYPESLDIRDPETNLYPFQTAAAIVLTEPSSVDSSGLSLDVTYELFRANPSHANTLIERRNRRDGSCRTSVGAHA